MKKYTQNVVSKLFFRLFSGLLLGLFSGSSAYANPNGTQVVNGQVNFSHPNANTLNISNSNGAIINWQQFSIQANEVTRFIQDSANSTVLNRIVGQDPSSILGQLLSNGHVFLINPNGIVFGPDAIIDTAGFVASTLNITDEDFINKNLKFQGSNAADISNKGYIKTGANGDIFLIAPNIENSGVIETNGGQIILAAGESVSIASLDSDHIVFDVQAPDNEVVNLGEITTHGGAASMFAGTIKHSGSINANSISVDENGKVQLFAQADIEIANDAIITANGTNSGEIKIESESGTVWNSGTIEATSDKDKGGHVEVLGERVALLDNASIDVSGETGGGEVLVGGGYQGKNNNVKNANQTYIGKETSIKANAITNGDGGKVIVWADETTQFYGGISAKGGSRSGDGGFVETSGKIYLEAVGSVDAGAFNGNAGEWLLDPRNVELRVVAPTPIIDNSSNGAFDSGSPNVFTPTGNTAIADIDQIVVSLEGGTSVTINTGATGSQNGDITVVDAITKTAGANATLTLNADNDININASITSTTGQLNLVLDAARTTGSGVINLENGVTLDANSGTITATNEAVKIGSFNTATINSTSTFGSLSLAGTGSTLTGTGNITVSGLTSATNSAVISGSGNFLANGGFNISSPFNMSIGRTIQMNGGTWSGGGNTITGGGKFVNNTGNILTNSGTFILGIELDNLGTFTKSGAGTFTINNSVFTTSGDVNINAGILDVNSTTFNWNGGVLQGVGTLDTAGVTTFNIGGTGTKTLSSFTLAPGALTVSAGILDINGGTLTVGGATTIDSGATVKVSTATFNPSGVFNNNGLLDLQVGNVSLGAGGTHAGDFNLGAGAVLQFTGGAHIISSGSDTSGAGSIAFTGGTTATYNVGSTYTISGDTGINGGNAVFNINAVTSSLTHASGSFGGGSTGSITTSTWTPTSGVTLNDLSLVLAANGTNTLTGITINTAGTAALTNQGSLILNGSIINPNFTNTGTLSIVSGSTLAGTATQTTGNLIVVGGATLTTAALNINGGTLLGAGTISGNVNNIGGILAAGNSPGTLSILGNYVQGVGGTFLAELAGVTTAGTDYDLLSVGGTTSLAGTLDIRLFGGFTGSVGDQFDIIQSTGAVNGDFTTVNVPTTHGFLNTPLANAYQIEIASITLTPTPTIFDETIDATNEIIVLDDFQNELTFTFVDEPESNEEDEEKRNLACR